jgi:hypothetical protein
VILSRGRTRSSEQRRLAVGLVIGILLFLLAPLLLVACPDLAGAAESMTAPCGYSADGRTVVCNADDFGVLLQTFGEEQAGRRLAEAQGAELSAKLKLLDADLSACRAHVCPVPLEPRSARWALVGFGAGVVGTALLGAGLTIDLPTEARLGIGCAGLLSLAGGLWLVLP